MLLRIDLMFVGTRFRGWQAQAPGNTVQDLLEEALKAVGHQGNRPLGCSRTDSGVHARTFTAHLETTLERDLAALTRGINANLPEDVRVYRISEPGGDFHARYSCTSKTYQYHLYLGEVVPPALAPYVWQFRGNPDRRAMEKACALFVGEHDFAAFTTREGREKNTVRRVDTCLWESRHPLFVLRVVGPSFLHRMVRCIGGALVAAGTGRISLDELSRALEGSLDGPLFPALAAQGLVLWEIEYPEVPLVRSYGSLPVGPLFPL